MSVNLPRLPFPEFPLRAHCNGQWYKSLWNPRTKRSEQFYFGSWQDDPQGERALHDPVTGWLARRSGIKAGTDNVRITTVSNCVTIGELMSSFLTSKRNQASAKDLSPRTLGDYIREIQKFVTFMKPATPVSGLGPAHFSSYMQHLIEERNLARYAVLQRRGNRRADDPPHAACVSGTGLSTRARCGRQRLTRPDR